MAESRLITISQAEISPNPVQVNKSYVIRVTIANRAYGLHVVRFFIEIVEEEIIRTMHVAVGKT